MNKSIIVYGPQGCGKTVNAERIRKHFGLTGKIVDDWRGIMDHKYGYALYLTNDSDLVSRARQLGMTAIPFADVAQQINAAIPKTQWFTPEVKPVNIGPYETQDNADRLGKGASGVQAWTGKYWGTFCSNFQDPDLLSFEHESIYQENYWRGLAEEPIIVLGGA